MISKLELFIDLSQVGENEISDFIQVLTSDSRCGAFIKINNHNTFAVVKHIPTGNEIEISDIDEFDSIINYLEQRVAKELVYRDITSSQRDYAENRYVAFFQGTNEDLMKLDDVIFLIINLEYPYYVDKFLEWKLKTTSFEFKSNIGIGDDRKSLFFRCTNIVSDDNIIKCLNSNVALFLPRNEISYFIYAIEEKYHRGIRLKVNETINRIDEYFRYSIKTKYLTFFQSADEDLNKLDNVIFLIINLCYHDYVSKFIEWKFYTTSIELKSDIGIGSVRKSLHFGCTNIESDDYIIKSLNSSEVLVLTREELLYFIHAIEEKYHPLIRSIVEETIKQLDRYFIDNPRRVFNVFNSSILDNDDLPF